MPNSNQERISHTEQKEEILKLTQKIDQVLENQSQGNQIFSTLSQVLQNFSNSLNTISEQNNFILPLLVSIRESTNLTLRCLPKRKKIRVVFLVHSMAMWDSLSEIYGHMLHDERFEPVIASLHSRHHGRGSFGGEDSVSASFAKQRIPHIRLEMLNPQEGLSILKSLLPDVIFRQQPWDGDVLPDYVTNELNFARLCMVPYGAFLLEQKNNETGENENFSGYDLAYHRAAWKVFCETAHIAEVFKSFQHSDPNKFIVAGFPKLDRLLQSCGHGHWPIADSQEKAFRVIWAPHHSVFDGSLGFGVFNQICIDMLHWAQSDTSIQFVLKPHPGLLNGILASGSMTEEQAKRYFQIWDSLENCTTSTEDYGALFDASDMMVTDSISFLVEYQFFDKPIIFIDSGRHNPFNALGKQAEACSQRVSTFAEIKAAVLFYKNGGKWGFETERERLKHSIRPNQCSASKIILDAIAEGMSENYPEDHAVS